MVLLPNFLASLAADSAADKRQSVKATLAPSWEKARAVSLPIPLPLPVTTTTLSLNSVEYD